MRETLMDVGYALLIVFPAMFMAEPASQPQAQLETGTAADHQPEPPTRATALDSR